MERGVMWTQERMFCLMRTVESRGCHWHLRYQSYRSPGQRAGNAYEWPRRARLIRSSTKVKAFLHGVRVLWCSDNNLARLQEYKPGLGQGISICCSNNGASMASLGCSCNSVKAIQVPLLLCNKI